MGGGAGELIKERCMHFNASNLFKVVRSGSIISYLIGGKEDGKMGRWEDGEGEGNRREGRREG